MESIVMANGTVKHADHITEGQLELLREWLPLVDKDVNILQAAAHWRNIQRTAESYGPAMIALMMEFGAIESEQDPMEALRNLLKASGF